MSPVLYCLSGNVWMERVASRDLAGDQGSQNMIGKILFLDWVGLIIKFSYESVAANNIRL